MAFLKSGVLGRFKDLPDQPLLIHPPRSRLLLVLAGLWLQLAVTVLLSTGFFFMIAVPLYVCFFSFYGLLNRHWKIYRYSTWLLHVLTFIVFVIEWIGMLPLRDILVQAIL